MDITPKKQSQFELFPSSADQTNSPTRQRYGFSFTNLTLTIENIVVLSIALIMTVVVFYAFGIERGKRVAGGGQPAVEKNPAKFSENDIIIESFEAPVETSKGEEIREIIEEKVIEEKIEILDIPEYVPEPEIVQDKYTIQVASFKLKKSAQKEANALKGKGYEISVLRKGNYSIVCVGKFAEKSEAKHFSSKLKKRYKDLLVRRL